MAPIHHAKWLATPDADALFQRLRTEISWEHREVMVFGKKTFQPRLTYYMAAEVYTYSGLSLQPSAIPEWLTSIMSQVGHVAGCDFNSILLNRYRDGADSIGWHADNEPELGKDPIVASLSLGASRDFDTRVKGSSQRSRVCLRHGDLLVMPAGFQKTHEHSMPKRAKANERISLTFRRVST